MVALAFVVLLAYLLGSLLGSLIVGKLRGGVDIRTVGSGNAGGTNALRTQGVGFAIWVMIIDIGKGWVATAIFPKLVSILLQDDSSPSSEWLPIACAIAVVLGHVYPIWFGFRGGKGAATLVGVVIGLKPLSLIVVLLIWLAVVMTTGFVGLATILATAGFAINEMRADMTAPLTIFGVAMTLFVAYTHRSNIARMRSGTENRVQRLWLLRPR